MNGASSPTSSAGHADEAHYTVSGGGNNNNNSNLDDAAVARKRKASRKKRLPTSMRAAAKLADDDDEEAEGPSSNSNVSTEAGGGGPRKLKKPKQKRKVRHEKVEWRLQAAWSAGAFLNRVLSFSSPQDKDGDGRPGKKARKQQRVKMAPVEGGLTAAQMAVNEQMRRALEEDQYSANGSIVDTDSDDDDLQYTYKGQSVRLDRSYLVQAARKHLWLERNAAGAMSSGAGSVDGGNGGTGGSKDDSGADGDDADSRRARGSVNKKKKKGKRGKDDERVGKVGEADNGGGNVMGGNTVGGDNEFERDEGSIFGQTTGSSNSTWVECDKCKKVRMIERSMYRQAIPLEISHHSVMACSNQWRRLRGVVDERKLPPKWYCSMNKNDPERARCSAPEEEYDAASTPESAADARTRKHLRVWHRRLQCNEAYESRQPTLTRNKKRQNTTSSKEPYEWIRCCNASCGKWRVILKSMDAKSHVIDRATDGEWYCVMNTWDEKVASCAAPQENLPAVGCPPWVIQGDN